MKVISTKLSNEEHKAMLEMVNLLGMNTAEYVRRCIMTDLCGGWNYDLPDEIQPQVEQMKARNETRFCGSVLPTKSNKTKSSLDGIIVTG